MEAVGIKAPNYRIACTASAIAFEKSRRNMIRLGIGMYGLNSYKANGNTKTPKLKPVLSFKTRVIFVKKVPKGALVGYGLTYKTKKPSVIAVLPVGYYDGYDRKLSNNAEVLINGVRCPVRGRVCMNIMMVDVTSAGTVKVGDEVVLIGRQGKQEVSSDEIAANNKTINYEIATRLNPLLPRIIVN